VSKKIQNKRTLRERPVAESAALSDTCNSSLWLHVRCLAYSATGRLQFLGYIDFQIINFTRPEGGDNTDSISPTDNAVKLFMWKSIAKPNIKAL
jgi:hypothetical protein